MTRDERPSKLALLGLRHLPRLQNPFPRPTLHDLSVGGGGPSSLWKHLSERFCLFPLGHACEPLNSLPPWVSGVLKPHGVSSLRFLSPSLFLPQLIFSLRPQASAMETSCRLGLCSSLGGPELQCVLGLPGTLVNVRVPEPFPTNTESEFPGGGPRDGRV